MRDEYRTDFDLGRGGFGRVIQEAGAFDIGTQCSIYALENTEWHAEIAVCVSAGQCVYIYIYIYIYIYMCVCVCMCSIITYHI